RGRSYRGRARGARADLSPPITRYDSCFSLSCSPREGPSMLGFRLCVDCSRRLRDAIFCPHCGAATCSWDCYLRHYAAEHRTTWTFPETQVVYDGDPATDDGGDSSPTRE